MPWKGKDIYYGQPSVPYYGTNRPMWTPELEAAFQRWFGTIAQPRGLANPDAYGQHYDYRGAWQGGAQPGLNNHWPSQYKYPEHPRTYINGYDTRTGGLAPMITNWLYEE